MTSGPLLAAAVETDPKDVTIARTTRDTKGGRRLHYELSCLQQPERARACGSGQKSAADRRPVDPPPVVELRVFEGPTREGAKEITPTYLSSFFVYADLQHARPMAHGRVQTPASTSPPVLTGSPVSGMCLLDRPREAGYFLFPDLSVRHEGRYVLGFTLYEEIKNEEDRDADPGDEDPTPGFYLRTRVLSNPFVVYSAKKFPGLTQSTNLSRTISEQGCRVRIRRDVRMRRRADKPDTSAPAPFNEEDAGRSRRTQTPVESAKAAYRNRSESNSSQAREAYPVKVERRPSEAEIAYPPPPAVAPSHVRYGSDMSNAGYTAQYAQSMVPQPPPISPTTGPYSAQQSPYAAVPPQPSAYPSRNPSYVPPTPSDSTYDRRLSAATVVPPSPSQSHYAPKEDYRRDTMVLEPMRVDPQPLSATTVSPSSSSSSKFRLPSLCDMVGDLHRDKIEAAPPSLPRVEEPARLGSKRAYDQTFQTSTEPLYHGQRPQDQHHTVGGRRSMYDVSDPSTLTYLRADGSSVSKPCNTFTYS